MLVECFELAYFSHHYVSLVTWLLTLVQTADCQVQYNRRTN